MPGGGRPKSVTELKLHGTFRKDRHAERAKQPECEGAPEKPSGLDADASKVWDRIVPDLIRRGLVGASDVDLIASTCEVYSLYQVCLLAAKANPADKELRCAVNTYLGTFKAQMKELRATPLERLRTVAPQKTEEAKGLSSFARRRTS